jgi:general secretion pathway protein G
MWNLGEGMRFIDFLDTLPILGQSQKLVRAFTMVELLIAIAIVATLSAIAVPSYTHYIDNARNTTAMADIREIESGMVRFRAERGRLPDSLAEAGVSIQLDPWGRPYEYLRIQGGDEDEIQHHGRKDHGTHPINTDFDLYSMGKDGDSGQPLTAHASWDDIVRANNGAFVGLASDY